MTYKKGFELGRQEVIKAIRAAVREIEGRLNDSWKSADASKDTANDRHMMYAEGVSRATAKDMDTLKRHLAPWLDEDDTLPLSPEAVEAMTQAKKILDQKETLVLSHDPVPFWVMRAMKRIKEVHGPLMRASTCMGVALAILREEAAKDGVEIYA